jgi:hypothetical protein
MRPRRERRSLSEQIVRTQSSQVKSSQVTSISPCQQQRNALPLAAAKSRVMRSPKIDRRALKNGLLSTVHGYYNCTSCTIVQDVDLEGCSRQGSRGRYHGRNTRCRRRPGGTRTCPHPTRRVPPRARASTCPKTRAPNSAHVLAPSRQQST